MHSFIVLYCIKIKFRVILTLSGLFYKNMEHLYVIFSLFEQCSDEIECKVLTEFI